MHTQLAEAGKAVSYWKTRLSCTLNSTPLPSHLRLTLETSQIKDTGDTSEDYIRSQLKDAWDNLSSVQKEADTWREHFLNELADHYASIRNTSREKEVRQLIAIEQIRNQSSNIDWYVKDRPHGMLRHLLVPNCDNANLEAGGKIRALPLLECPIRTL